MTITDDVIRGAAVLFLAFLVGAGFHDLHRIADSLEALAAECGTTPDTETTP